MIGRYLRLREYCQKNEWAAGLSALLLLALLGLVIYLTLNNQSALEHWLNSSVLVHGLMLFSVLLLLAVILASLLCLSLSPASMQDRTERVIHRHRPVMQDGLKVVKNLGVNPKRRHKPARNASS